MLLRPLLLIVVLSLTLSGCRSTGRLAEFEFQERSLAVVYNTAPRPAVLTGPYFFGKSDDLLRSILNIGTTVVKEMEAASVRRRLDSAVARVDVTGRMAQRTLERSARYMRARATTDEAGADFIFEVTLRDYGIDAKEWNAAAHFYVDADVKILSGDNGALVWSTHVKERDTIAPMIFGPGRNVREVITAASLAGLSVDEIAVALESLADYTSDRLTNRLQNALEKVRR